jgi:hypothetical protein
MAKRKQPDLKTKRIIQESTRDQVRAIARKLRVPFETDQPEIPPIYQRRRPQPQRA